MNKYIELVPLADMGEGYARVTPGSVEIEVKGINGGMKAWLVGGEAVEIGNIVGGKLRKEINTAKNSKILITQSGRQLLIGEYAAANNAEAEAAMPFELGDFVWKKVNSRSYLDLCRELRYILSNESVYQCFKKYRHYWVGENKACVAVALNREENEPDPLEFLGKMKFTKNGYTAVCVDKKTKKLCIPEVVSG